VEHVPAETARRKAPNCRARGVSKFGTWGAQVVKNGGRIVTPILGPPEVIIFREGVEKWHLFFGTRRPGADLSEALAFWNLNRYAHKQVPPTRRPLHLNLDETAIRLYSPAQGGNLVAEAMRLRKKGHSLATSTGKNRARACLTHVAIVADDSIVQPVLPQVIILKSALVNQQEFREIVAHKPDNVFVLRRERAWITADIMVWLAGVLARCLATVRPKRHVFISCDAFKAHTTHKVFRAFARHDLHYLILPAKLTWAIQPLDTHVFSLYKTTLQLKSQVLLLGAERGRQSWTLLARAIAQAIKDTMEGHSWMRAFLDTGLADDSASISKRVLEKLSFAATPMVDGHFPTLSELQAIFPARLQVPIDDLFSQFLHQPRPETEHGGPSSSSSAWTGRLRSSSLRNACAKAASSTSPSHVPPKAPWPPPAPRAMHPMGAPVGRPLWNRLPHAPPTPAAPAPPPPIPPSPRPSTPPPTRPPWTPPQGKASWSPSNA
jgi:hypothetical protein